MTTEMKNKSSVPEEITEVRIERAFLIIERAERVILERIAKITQEITSKCITISTIT